MSPSSHEVLVVSALEGDGSVRLVIDEGVRTAAVVTARVHYTSKRYGSDAFADMLTEEDLANFGLAIVARLPACRTSTTG